MTREQAKYTIGLALSGGGAKGIAHIGVIKALEEHGLKPEIISGVSAGSIIGAMYADGKTCEEMCTFFKETKFWDYVSPSIKRKGMRGLMKTDRMEYLLKGFLNARTFEELQIPLIINATELNYGKNEYFSSGELIEHVIASSSVPIVLTPKEFDGKIYVDGGIFNNMPCRVIRRECAFLAGCHVNPIMEEKKISNIIDVAERVYNLSIQSSTVPEKKFCDLLLEPIEARNFGIFDIAHTDKIYNIGYDYTSRMLDSIEIDLNHYKSLEFPSDIEIIP